MLKKAVLRGAIPLVIMSVLSLIMSYQKIDPFSVRSVFLNGIIIALVAAASVIYEIEEWSIYKQSIVHFIIMLLTVFPCLLLSGWFRLESFIDYLKVLGMFLTAGIVFWSIGYFVFGKLLNK